MFEDTKNKGGEYLPVLVATVVIQNPLDNGPHVACGEGAKSGASPQGFKAGGAAFQRFQQGAFLLNGEFTNVAVQPGPDRVPLNEFFPRGFAMRGEPTRKTSQLRHHGAVRSCHQGNDTSHGQPMANYFCQVSGSQEFGDVAVDGAEAVAPCGKQSGAGQGIKQLVGITVIADRH